MIETDEVQDLLRMREKKTWQAAAQMARFFDASSVSREQNWYVKYAIAQMFDEKAESIE